MDSLTSSMNKLSIKAKATATVIQIPFRNSEETVQVTLFKKIFRKKSVPRFDLEEPDEVEQGVRDWYAALGQPVPAADMAFMAAMKGLPVEEPVEVAPVIVDEMPPHGTPEFWAWCRRRRAAANAERAAKGLPPLPTAAQKAKAAAAKLVEKAAAKAAKDAAKAAKDAAKDAKDAAKDAAKVAK